MVSVVRGADPTNRVAPVVLGAGVPLFKPGSPRQNLTLLQSRPLATGGVILRYAAKPHDA